MKLIITCAIAAISCPAFSGTLSPSEQDQIMATIAKVKTAFEKRDFKVIINLMPERYFKLSEEKKASKVNIAKNTVKKLNQLKFNISRLEYTKPTTSFECKLSKITFVKAKMDMEVKGKKLTSSGYLIASLNVSKDGSKKQWRFLDGAKPLARQRSFYDKMYGCKGLKIAIPEFSIKPR